MSYPFCNFLKLLIIVILLLKFRRIFLFV